MKPIVDVQGLSYAYRGFEDRWVLRDINLQILPGEFFAMAGRTGSGKSTLCYTMNGLVPHSFGGKIEGKVLVAGMDTRETSPASLASKVGMVLQSAESQLVGLTVREDVEFALENIALSRNEIQKRADWALQVVNLDNHQDFSPWNLSGGQKQRLAIASALALRPQLLVLDNPTAELDPVGKEEVLETIAILNRDHGITIFIIDQELHEIMPFADRLAILDEGHLLMVDTPHAVLDRALEIREAGVKLPDVTEVAYQLRKRNQWKGTLPISIEEAAPPLVSMFSTQPNAERRPPAKADSREILVEMRDVYFNYPNGKEVLRRVNLDIRAGEFVALMGQNGAGKTTLAKHLNGLLKPSQGEIIVEGKDTRQESVADLATRVGYVFQNPDHQIFSETVGQELAFGPKNLNWPEERIEKAVIQALEDIHMQDRRTAEPFFMGLAERKLIAIASVLIMDPELLVLDEPATGADYNVALQIMRYITDLHRRGLTVVIITHDVSLAANYASRMIVMKDGSIKLDGSPREVFQQHEELRECKVALPEVARLSHALGRQNHQQIIRVADMVSALEEG